MTWHYLNDNCEPSTYSPEQEVASSPTSSSGTVPSALSSLMPSVETCSSPDSATASSPASRSGTTCEPSTGDHGAEQLTLSLEGSPARTSARRVKVRDLPEPVVDFGSRCSESLARSGLRLSGRKTVRYCGPVASAPSYKDLPAWGMTVDGEWWELATLVRHIDASDSGYLPTPAANSYGTNHGGAAGRTGKVGPSLETMARHDMWPTPTAGDSKSSGSRNTAQSKAHPGVSLTDAVRQDGGRGRQWATPTARDWRSGKASAATMARNARPLSEQVGAVTNGGKLNPRFVEFLMGWPCGWTTLEPMTSPVLMSYHEEKIRSASRVSSLWGHPNPKKDQWSPGGHGRIQKEEALQPTVHGSGNGEGRGDAGRATVEVEEIPGEKVPRVRRKKHAGGSPHRWQPGEQRAEEPADIVRQLSHIVALEEWEAYAEEAVGLHRLWSSCAEAGHVSEALPTLQEVWRSLSDEGQNWVILRALSGDPWGQGEWPQVHRTSSGINNRVRQLRALGNGQVPQQAALAWTVLSQGLTG